ncbi:MAG: cytochrome P450 [Pseudonocardiaceae bacterium]
MCDTCPDEQRPTRPGGPALSTDGPALIPAGTPGLASWQIVRYQQARWALSARCLSKDPQLAWEALGHSHLLPSSAEDQQRCIRNMASTDPPGHTRLRTLLAKALTPERMKRMRPRIVRVIRVLADRMIPARSVDLVRSFIFPLQVIVTCDLLGVPPHQRGDFRSFAAGMRAQVGSEGCVQNYHEAYRRMGVLVAEVLATKLDQVRTLGSPDLQPDVLSAMVSARDDSDGLTVPEMQSMAMLIISAGQEPTIDLIANGMLAMLLNPDQLQTFRRHPELRTQAVEELLRHEPPILSTPRIAAQDIKIGGTVVRRGSIIAVMIECTNRDPSQFREPDALDVTRKRNEHLTFGHGIHYCIGAPLARLQATEALTALVTRFPHIALAQSPQRLRWRSVAGGAGLVELPVALGSRAIQPPWA